MTLRNASMLSTMKMAMKQQGAVNLSRREIHSSIDINVPHQNDNDDEIADVDVSEDEDNLGYNAAEALRARVVGERLEERCSTQPVAVRAAALGAVVKVAVAVGVGLAVAVVAVDSKSSDGKSVTSI